MFSVETPTRAFRPIELLRGIIQRRILGRGHVPATIGAWTQRGRQTIDLTPQEQSLRYLHVRCSDLLPLGGRDKPNTRLIQLATPVCTHPDITHQPGRASGRTMRVLRFENRLLGRIEIR
jgi:hypothetical protein